MKKEKRGDLARLEEQLADKLAAVVEIRMLKKTRHGESGEIAISFGSNDELGGLLERLGLAEEQLSVRRPRRLRQVAGHPRQRAGAAGVNCQASRLSVSSSPRPPGRQQWVWPDSATARPAIASPRSIGALAASVPTAMPAPDRSSCVSAPGAQKPWLPATQDSSPSGARRLVDARAGRAHDADPLRAQRGARAVVAAGQHEGLRLFQRARQDQAAVGGAQQLQRRRRRLDQRGRAAGLVQGLDLVEDLRRRPAADLDGGDVAAGVHQRRRRVVKLPTVRTAPLASASSVVPSLRYSDCASATGGARPEAAERVQAGRVDADAAGAPVQLVQPVGDAQVAQARLRRVGAGPAVGGDHARRRPARPAPARTSASTTS